MTERAYEGFIRGGGGGPESKSWPRARNYLNPALNTCRLPGRNLTLPAQSRSLPADCEVDSLSNNNNNNNNPSLRLQFLDFWLPGPTFLTLAGFYDLGMKYQIINLF